MATIMNSPVVKQLKYFNINDSRNSPAGTDWLDSYNLLEDGPAIKLGIQALPGTIFHIGSSNLSSGIIIDHTGIYELDLTDTTTNIGTLYFDPESLARIDMIDNACIIVDILYNPSDGTVNL